MTDLSGAEILPVLHNVYSQQRVVEAARVVYGLGFRTFIVTKASSSAAQTGVPEAQKMALKTGRTFIYLPDLPDAIEVLKPDKVLLFLPKKYAQLPLSEVVKNVSGRLLAVFGGSDPGLSKRELELGIAAYPDGVEEDVGSIGMVAITLFLLRSLLPKDSGSTAGTRPGSS